MQLVLEDDFELLDKGGDFLARLKALMAQLPEDREVRASAEQPMQLSRQSSKSSRACTAAHGPGVGIPSIGAGTGGLE
jgi:hypothetical protein